jgi:hypothetical protein
MASDPGFVPVSGKILNSLAASTAVMANGRSQNTAPSSIAATPHGGTEPKPDSLLRENGRNHLDVLFKLYQPFSGGLTNDH